MVGQAFAPAPESLPATLRVSEAAASVNRETGAWPVVDQAGLRGMLTVEQLDRAWSKKARATQTLGELVPAPDPDRLNAEDFPHLHADHSLDMAMRRLAETGLKVLPVVSRTNIRELKGTISMPDILAAYAMGKVEQEAEPVLPKGKPVALLAGVLAVLIGLAVVGGLLSYYYRTERAGRAQHFYEQGNQFCRRTSMTKPSDNTGTPVHIAHQPVPAGAGPGLVKAGHPDEATFI